MSGAHEELRRQQGNAAVQPATGGQRAREASAEEGARRQVSAGGPSASPATVDTQAQTTPRCPTRHRNGGNANAVAPRHRLRVATGDGAKGRGSRAGEPRRFPEKPNAHLPPDPATAPWPVIPEKRESTPTREPARKAPSSFPWNSKNLGTSPSTGGELDKRRCPVEYSASSDEPWPAGARALDGPHGRHAE